MRVHTHIYQSRQIIYPPCLIRFDASLTQLLHRVPTFFLCCQPYMAKIHTKHTAPTRLGSRDRWHTSESQNQQQITHQKQIYHKHPMIDQHIHSKIRQKVNRQNIHITKPQIMYTISSLVQAPTFDSPSPSLDVTWPRRLEPSSNVGVVAFWIASFRCAVNPASQQSTSRMEKMDPWRGVGPPPAALSH